jgi:hypothetical protein
MSSVTKEKLRILFAIVIVFLAWLGVMAVLPPPPVHKVNKACCSADACAIQHHHEKDARTNLTDKQLKLWFDDLNHDYFLGQLPKDVEVKWGDLSAQNYMGLTQFFSNGEFIITVDRATHPTLSETKMTLMHEACHIKTWYVPELSHGPKFQNCMVNLATHGAFEGVW